MSTLTLRVSGEKKKKRLRKYDEGVEEFRAAIDKLRESYEHSCLNQLYDTTGVDQQINVVREIVERNFEGKSDISEKQIYLLEILVEVYLIIELKHPLKSALVRLLSSLPQELEITLRDIFVKLLTKRFDDGTDDLKIITEKVSSLSGCFENFCLTLPAVEACKNKAAFFLENALQVCLINLKQDRAPTIKLRAINCIHAGIRCVMTLMQKTCVSVPVTLLQLVKTLLLEEQLPLDVRFTCGILAVILAKESDPEGLTQLIGDIFPYEDIISQLSICNGIFSTALPAELNSTVPFGGSSLSLFNFSFKTIMTVSRSNPADSGLILGVSRGVHQASKSLLNLSSISSSPTVSQEILSFVWSHLEHYMDSVRHLATSTLQNMVNLADKSPDGGIHDMMMNALEALPGWRRSKQVALCSLIGHIPVGDIMLKSPNLVATLLTSIQETSGATHAISTLESLMTQHFKETGIEEDWVKLWVDPLISAMKDKPNPAFEQVLVQVVKLHPKVIHYVLSLNSSQLDENMNIPLICLRVGRKVGFLNGTDSHKWKGLMAYDVLEDCMCHKSSEVSLACFALIAESQKSTEPLTKEELNLVKRYLQYNINNENPAVRQKSLATFKKFMARLKDSTNALEKLAKRQVDTEHFSHSLSEYNEFVEWLMNFCNQQLFPGASFSRRSSVLRILILCKEFGFWKKEFCKPSVLLTCLFDTYEENQGHACSLLGEVTAEILNFDKDDYVEDYMRECLVLSSSIKPIDCIVAAYALGLLTSVSESGRIIRDIATRDTSMTEFFHQTEIKELSVYFCLCIVIGQLKKELNVAEKSLLEAASTGPLYGQLFVIRHLLQKVDLRSVGDDVSWKLLIENLIKLAFSCDKAVASIVNSSSPEGLIPMDLDYDVCNLDSESDLPHVTAQMVLLCSWRSVKEVSLLLGEMAERAPIYCDEEERNGLLSEEQIVAIGDHLTTLLAETKHRGAFEQAYVGFCKLASTLWRFPCGNLHQLPNKWLQETLEEIKLEGKLCATRRSAGIPFMIQGLVCTELEVGGGTSFQSCIRTVLSLGGEAVREVETRTHAMNILRSLFRNSQLGEMVSPYLPQAIQLAIDGFASNTWPERNAATLLLSALMTRVFGVARSRSDEDLSWRNKMTGRIFFLRYPSLYSVLLGHLEAAASAPHYPPLYPVLLILGRLYPSSLEGTDSNLQLCKYIPYVNSCAGSSVLKTRTLAATAMVALITPNIYFEHFISIFKQMCNTASENLIHGLLLQVFNLLRSDIELSQRDLGNMKSYVPFCSIHVFEFLSLKDHCFLTKETCLKVLHQLGLKFHTEIDSGLWVCLETKIHEDLFTDTGTYYKSMGIHKYHITAVLFYLWLQFGKGDVENFVTSLAQFLEHPSYEIYCTGLEVIQFLVLGCENDQLEEEVCTVLGSVDPYFIAEIKEKLKSHELISKILTQKFSKTAHYTDKKKILSVMKNFSNVFRILSETEGSVIMYFYKICQEEHELLGANAVECIDVYISSQNLTELNDEELNLICQICDEFSSPERDFECRLAVSHLLNNSFENLILRTSLINVISFWTYKVRLLMDDEHDIRELMSKGNVNPVRALEVCLEEFTNSNLPVEYRALSLLSWALGEFQESHVDLEDRVFDKGDMNSYSEDIVLNRLASCFLKNLAESNPGLTDAELPPGLTEWISSRCSINFTENTLLGLVTCAEKLIRDKNCVDHKYPFFKTSKRKILLQQIKLDSIVSSLKK